MTITPLPGQVYLKLAQDKIGKFDTSSRESAVEFAEVLAVGEGVNPLSTVSMSTINYHPSILSVGDKVFVKAWALDCVNYGGEKYYFVNIDSGGILAKIND